MNTTSCTPPTREILMSSQDNNIYNNETSIKMLSTPTCSTSKSDINMFLLFECSAVILIIILYNLKYFPGNIFTSNVFQCKLAKKSHSCTFQNGIINDRETLLLSMAHQLCKISGKY